MTTSHTQSLLSIHDLVIRFGDADSGVTPVVDHVGLSVERGEIVALVGESGSGKSMTARAALGLLPPGAQAQGSIILAGDQVVGASERSLNQWRGTRAAMVFQEPQTALNPVRKVGWQIAQALRAHGKVSRSAARAQAVELLRMVEIPEPEVRVDWYPHQLSGGQKQRVVIALALSGRPALLIADEPTTALDVTVQEEILGLLRRLRDRSGTAILLITHNMGVVADIADRVIVLERGRIVEESSVATLFSAPRHEYTKALLAAVPRLPEPGDVAETTPPGADADAVLSLHNVSVVFPARHGNPEFRAVSGVSLDLFPGEVLGLVGESGSGKTTLGRSALGITPVTAGEVLLGGHNLSEMTAAELRKSRRGMALVHQDPAASLDPRRSVGESIGEPLEVHRVASGTKLAARVGDLLDAVKLPRSYAHRRPGELSGGQRQRVALARALALAPRLLVADEPTSALDVSVQAEILELFAELRAEHGFACLFISHDLAVVHQVSDRVAVMRGGDIVELGSAEQVFGNPTHAYTRDLVAAVPIPDPVRQRERRAGAVFSGPLAVAI